MKIYLIRHGKDPEGFRGGWSPYPLTEEGLAQAEKLAESVGFPVDAIYSSDLPRAMQTAIPLAEKYKLPILERPEFRETNNGELAGMQNELALLRYPGLFWNTLDWEQSYPGGESPREFYERIRTAWVNFQHEVKENQKNAVLVTHGGVIQVIRCILTGQPYSNKGKYEKVEYTQVITLEYREDQWREV